MWPHIYTLFLVVVGWAMFVGNDTGVAFGLLFRKLFVPSGGVSPLYFLRNYGVLLAVSVVCCTPLIEKLWNVLRNNVVTRARPSWCCWWSPRPMWWAAPTARSCISTFKEGTRWTNIRKKSSSLFHYPVLVAFSLFFIGLFVLDMVTPGPRVQ